MIPSVQGCSPAVNHSEARNLTKFLLAGLEHPPLSAARA